MIFYFHSTNLTILYQSHHLYIINHHIQYNINKILNTFIDYLVSIILDVIMLLLISLYFTNASDLSR